MNEVHSAAKIAIPRIKREGSVDNPHRKRHSRPRAQRACESCRKRKVKCTGEQPSCFSCSDQGLSCVYQQFRKDRLKDLSTKNSRLIAFLRDASTRMDPKEQKRTIDFLESLKNDSTVVEPTSPLSSPQKRRKLASSSDKGYETQNDDEETLQSELNSSEDDTDLLDENLLRDNTSRATGFVGRNSEVQWLRRLQMQGGKPSGSGDSTTDVESTVKQADTLDTRKIPLKLANLLNVSDSSFYLDRDDIDTDIQVDPHVLPNPDRAELLFECYMKTVHSSFPVLPDDFVDQFQRYNDSVRRKRPLRVPNNWKAMLNFVLAIGAQYSHLAQAKWQTEERDHLIYMTRAIRILGLDNIVASLSAPKLSLIQATGLLSLYYLTIGHVGRAWMMIGISLRFALAAGLHVQNDNFSTSLKQKEGLVRIWWSLHSIESLICGVIGRPCIIPNDECTVPLPDAVFGNRGLRMPTQNDSDPTTNLTFLGARSKVALIMQKILSKLYSPQTSAASWEYIQNEIASLAVELDEWVVTTLSKETHPADSAIDSKERRERLLLNFHYQSARLILYRPCLCRLERRTRDQSIESAQFNQRTAEACIEAAQAITQLFPEEPNLDFIYKQGPWWCMVHYIMQALAVFLLEVSFRVSPMVQEDDGIIKSTKKLLDWLQFMSRSNAVAERAYQVAVKIILKSTERFQFDISEILAKDEADINAHGSNQLDSASTTEQYHPDITYDVHNILSSEAMFNNPSKDLELQASTLPVAEQYMQFEPFQFDNFTIPYKDFPMPGTFGNPFITNFDQHQLFI
ncbi:hypothetical protein BS50DRAFT_566888 [Corynespora cassiicola Philippines]|uniref:Zn(2)-C6 fungal-type domain-containing protein n=1 Tax=Corynespora cassiicola Philippines TaxID=1448308 RepID=A0A2T2P8I7_CORCC|nr:hypothetical protein BS50DRAFT_566888 [Corynespora cassiicola Philippines]